MSAMGPVDDPVAAYRRADQRLQELLFGDGVYVLGLVKGEESRRQVTRELRHMRDALKALVESGEGRAATAEARVADLEEELRKAASAKTRRSRSRSK